MKLSNSVRKALAYVCAIAMVISSITVYNQTSVKANGTATVDGIVYTVTDGSTTLPGFTCQGIFDKARIHFAWGEDVDADSITVTVNNQAVTADGKNARGVFFPLSEISGLAEGEYQIVVSAVKTETSENVTGNATLKIEAEGETTPRDPSLTVWVEIGEGYSYDDTTEASVISIQQPEWAAEKGIYVNVPSGINSVSVNGVSGDTVGFVQGAGAIVYLSALTYETNNVVIEYAGGTATVKIKNENGTGGDAPQPETTPAAPVIDGDELLSNTAFTDATSWNEYGFTSATNNGDGSLSLAMEAKTGGDNWSSQLVQNGLSLTQGKWYVAKYTVTSDVDKTFQLLIQSDGAAGGDWSVFSEQFTELKAGETKDVELKFQAGKTGNKNVLFGIMMGYVNNTASDAANVVISNVSLKVYNSDPAGGETDPQPTDPQPTDPQPTDPQPTDPQPTDPQPTDPQPTDPQPTDPQPTDPAPISGRQLPWDVEDSYLAGWTGSSATMSTDGDSTVIAIANTGWSEGDNSMWAIQAKTAYVKVIPGTTYTYQTTLVSDKDKEVFVKVTDVNESEIGTRRVALKANEPQTVSIDFTPEVEEIRVIYALGTMGTEVQQTDVNVTVTGSVLAGEEPTEVPTDAPTEKPTEKSTEAPTVPTEKTTTPQNETTAKKVTVGKTKVKTAYKKLTSKKVKISLKKIKNAKKYQVQISTTKKFKKVLVKKTVKKVKFTLSSRKLKNKKKLYVRARAVRVVGKKVYRGKWSVVKKVKIKK